MANLLIHEQSPYLLQHAHNPVDWHPWGDDAFAKAKEHNKPVLVSIGYSACHWCHVMERESFESTSVAAFMNEHFVCIKVDREEHPDVDHLYMDAVQAMSGSGGWPLNAFVTPDRIPFYGGTYFPPKPAFNRPSWMDVLQQISDVWTNQYDEVARQSNQMLDYLKQASAVAVSNAVTWDKEACDKTTRALLAMADKEWGGFGNAPKFPGTMAINFLLDRYHFYKDEVALRQALLSLDSMIDGGIYDQLGGGFARYSTDKYWLAPHFEKMLYDNALIITSLCNAYMITNKPVYREVIEETISFVRRELKHESGGFYSALDADSEGVEGKFYTFTWEEWSALFPDGNPIAASFFGISTDGNWEHTNILHRAKTISEVAVESGRTEAEVAGHLDQTKKALRQARNARVRPGTDDKCLLSWNALMNTALMQAGIALQREDYINEASSHMDWMVNAFATSSGYLHTWKNGQARIAAKLDDYAYLTQAMLQLGAVTGHNQWLHQAEDLVRVVIKEFSADDGFFYYTSENQKDIPVRKVDVYDGATPSANAVTAQNLILVGLISTDNILLTKGETMLHTISGTVVRYVYSFGYWAMLLQQYLTGFKSVVVVGDEGREYGAALRKHYLPGIMVLASLGGEKKLSIQGDKENKAQISMYVCTAHECLPLEMSVEGVLKQLFPAR